MINLNILINILEDLEGILNYFLGNFIFDVKVSKLLEYLS